MLTYDIPLVPGPTHGLWHVRRAYLADYGSADLEPGYAEHYIEMQDKLRRILGTQANLGPVKRGMDILAQILIYD
jgi:hypothetical protein